jgi:hypothetical protein
MLDEKIILRNEGRQAAAHFTADFLQASAAGAVEATPPPN